MRIKTSPNSKKKSVQIVQSVRKGKSVSQKIVRHIGTALDSAELTKLKELAEFIKAKLESQSNPALFSPETIAEMAIEARRAKEDETELKVNLKNLREESRVIVGIHEVYGSIYKDLGFDKVIKNPKRNAAANKKLFNIVMARIANPKSKRSSVIELEKDFGIKLSLEGVYKMMDKLDDKAIEKIEMQSYVNAKEILKEKINVVFYECTTLYFESFSENDLKQKGYGKDMKFNQPQVLLALVSTSEGLPIGYQIYPCSQYKGSTLRDATKKLKEKYEVEKIVVVADSALLNKENIEDLENEELEYILGARIKNMSKKVEQEILDKSKYKKLQENSGEKIVEIILTEKKRLIVTYSEKRAEKDKKEREKAVKKLKEKMNKSKNPANLMSNYGYKKYLKITGETKVELDEVKLAKSSAWDGLHGIITNKKDFTAEGAIEYYHRLWQLEENFRISKHDLRIRPIYHWTPKRVRAHLAISFMASVCERHLEFRVKKQYKKLSLEVIRNELLHSQCSIVKNLLTNKKYCIPSKTTREMKKIYQTVGKKIDSIPFEIK
ncbi:MAG: IS1634 family transposase [Chlorobi bacterium]|nr:IS1634 family transposase [Chlorobiota bacterium]